ncbi:MAG: hypothetical protein J0H27_06230 [Xanthomonadales bacterium]|nr:hypothetical protein [Xanthomonadales bacterium]
MTVWLALRALAVWMLILGLAFSNAALRELVLIPRLGKVQGLTLSGVILALLVLLVAFGSVPWLGARRASQWIAIGLGWFVLTLAFDLVLGLLQHKPMHLLFEAYLFKQGNLWPVVLLITAIAPYLAARLRGWV